MACQAQPYDKATGRPPYRVQVFPWSGRYIGLSPVRITVATRPPLYYTVLMLPGRYIRKLRDALAFVYAVLLTACAPADPQTLITYADARTDKAQIIDTGEPGDSVGDILVFDQPLLDEHRKPVGNNSGFCIRTRLAHSFQCQWTLSLEEGTVQVAGREFDEGESSISIVGGTDRYAGIRGDMTSVKNRDGTFTQTLNYWLHQR